MGFQVSVLLQKQKMQKDWLCDIWMRFKINELQVDWLGDIRMNGDGRQCWCNIVSNETEKHRYPLQRHLGNPRL